MAKPPPRSRKRLNIFDDSQLGPQGIEGAFADATNRDAVSVEPPRPSPPPAPADSASPPAQAARALEAPSRPPAGPRPDPQVVRQRERHVPFEARIPQQTREQFAEFKARLGSALGGIRLTDSQIVRALLECLLVNHADGVLDAAGLETRPLKRPANQDRKAQAEFDAILISVFRDGFSRRRRRRRPPAAPEASA